MIVAAGLGTRLRPLTDLRAKPALPIRGIPLVTFTLELLAAHGVDEVMINVHHLAPTLIEAAERGCPAGIRLHFSHERELLDTGGAIRRVRGFLAESDPCLIVGGDMLLDYDLSALVAWHQEADNRVSMLLRRDPRASEFGTLGVDADGRVRRIAQRFDLGGACDAGVYTWANVVSAEALASLPERQAFSHLDDWIAPQLSAGCSRIRARVASAEACLWEPVGTPAEYLAANLAPLAMRTLDVDARSRADGTQLVAGSDGDVDLVVGRHARLGADVRLHRAVVWDGEKVPDGFEATGGVFAGASWHPCPDIGARP